MWGGWWLVGVGWSDDIKLDVGWMVVSGCGVDWQYRRGIRWDGY